MKQHLSFAGEFIFSFLLEVQGSVEEESKKELLKSNSNLK